MGLGESIANSLWQTSQELDQVQVGLRIPVTENTHQHPEAREIAMHLTKILLFGLHMCDGVAQRCLVATME